VYVAASVRPTVCLSHAEKNKAFDYTISRRDFFFFTSTENETKINPNVCRTPATREGYANRQKFV